MKAIYFILTSITIIAMTAFSNGHKLSVTSTAFTNNGMIPSKYSCEGTEVSPPLYISAAPASAKSLALIVHDPDSPMAGGMTHWVMWNIDLNGNIPEGYKGAMQGLNGKRKTGYIGMCPPSGTHHYNFKAYALDVALNIDKNTDEAGLEKAMEGHIVGMGELTGLYKKVK